MDGQIVTGHAQSSQLIKDGLPIPFPGSYSVGSSSLLGEPDKRRRCSGAIVRYLTHHVSQDMYQFQEGFPSPMIELRSRPAGGSLKPSRCHCKARR